MEFGTPVRLDCLRDLVRRSNMESELLWMRVCGDGANGMSSGIRSTSHWAEWQRSLIPVLWSKGSKGTNPFKTIIPSSLSKDPSRDIQWRSYNLLQDREREGGWSPLRGQQWGEKWGERLWSL